MKAKEKRREKRLSKIIGYLNRKKIPIWLVVIITLCPLLISQCFDNRSIEEYQKEEKYNQVVEYASNLKIYSQWLSSHRKDLESLSFALSSNVSNEMVARFAEVADDSQKMMLEKNKLVVNNETELSLNESKLRKYGYDISSVLKKPIETLKRIDMGVSTPLLKDIAPNDRVLVIREDIAKLQILLITLLRYEDEVNGKIESLRKILGEPD